ncbi:MAG: hypothetical protein H6709_03930 [Kofleriaceae bacterium]|nr:hypothetical protein [Kofleriaceae bacterium]
MRAAAAADAEAQAAAGDAGLAVTRAALAEAEGSRDRLRAAAGLAAHRAELVDGEPCPLCGAAEHPWAGQGVVDELVAAQDGWSRPCAPRSSAAPRRWPRIAPRPAPPPTRRRAPPPPPPPSGPRWPRRGPGGATA